MDESEGGAEDEIEPGAEDETEPGLDDEVDERRPLFRRPLLLILAGVLVVGLGIGLGIGLTGGSPAAPVGPEGVPLQQVPDLAPASTTASGAPVDGITCRKTMAQKVGYHIHAHLDIFVNGQQRRIPAGAGIAAPRFPMELTNGLFVDNGLKGCLYFLHVHSNDGIIHIEAPNKHTYTLGQFFDIWRQPLSSDQVGPAKGPVVAIVNGKVFPGNPRNIPLLSQADIQLDVGQPVVPFQPLHFTVIGLCGGNTFTCGRT
jgi:hypothetical protein